MGDLLRLATAGSVDDGKSTLIGRLLHDSKSIFEDQLEAVELSSRRRGDVNVNLALLTDGLRAEREQGITIDVAYRYFATPRRKFIIADTPGHVQYTRNMVTGASTADLAVVLVDARNGLVEQSRRHAFLATLLGIRHLVLCVNKMDLVGWDEAVFDAIAAEFSAFVARLEHGAADVEVTPIPVSALHGDNVVDPSPRLGWYTGSPLLEHLEKVDVRDHDPLDARFPVQYVIRPHSDEHHDFRGYAGSLAGGLFRPGDEVCVLPGGLTTRIAAIDTFDGPVDEASAPMAVTLLLEDDLDVSRGDVIVRCGDREPAVAREVAADVCWMTDAPLRAGSRYAVKHTTRSARAVVDTIEWALDVNTLDRSPAASLGLNAIGRVRLRLSTPLVADDYDRNRTTGSFILVDESTNATAGAGLIRLP
ncbi:MAG TPA: GTP-binding protein [Acidimicrobiales bacterium]|nr:GTP-binding protein [Acidimicrobiales bacterium]